MSDRLTPGARVPRMPSNYERGVSDGKAACVPIIDKLAARLKEVERDRDEWKQQHENLLAVRQQDIAALMARAPAPSRDAAPVAQALLLEAATFLDNSMFQSLGQAGRAQELSARIRAALARAPLPTDKPQAVNLFTCKGKGGEYELVGYSNGAGPKRGESIVVYRRAGDDDVLYHRSADDFRDRMEWLGARAPLPAVSQKDGVEVSSAWLDRDGRMIAALRDFIEGMSVSMDVSTGDHDAGHRYFGIINEVMDDDGDKNGVTLLVYDAQPNFASPAATTASASRPSDGEIYEAVSRRANPEGHAAAMAQIDAVLWLRQDPPLDVRVELNSRQCETKGTP